jgi:NAD dependent epimerase/dehydratase
VKNILITGADGFIGSHLTELLVGMGFNVRALAQYNSLNKWGWLDEIDNHPNLEIVTGDIRDLSQCRQITKNIDTIFHLAALISIPYSYLSPQSYIDTNINGTANICQAALDNCVKHLLCTSTSEVYGTAQYVPINELHPLQPQSPYSASKIGADSIAISYNHAFKLPVTIVRPFNTYGPRQSARAVIPTIITQIAGGIRKIHVGDLSPTRDFNYVSDVCEGFYAIATNQKSIGQTINIGSNYEISIRDTLEIIKKIMKIDVDFIEEKKRIRPKESEVYRLLCDNKKLYEMTSFKPKTNIYDGLKKTIDWFTDDVNLKHYKFNIYNV